MRIDIEKARALKLAVKDLQETPHGQVLWEFMETMGGKYKPQYPEMPNAFQGGIACGKSEFMQTLRSIDILEPEHIVNETQGVI